MIVFYVIEDAQMKIDFNDGIELAATDNLKLWVFDVNDNKHRKFLEIYRVHREKVYK